MATHVQCPVCTQTVIWSEASPWRPFCSERCKLIDLGDWAAERHVIAGEPVNPAAGNGLDQPEPDTRTH